MKKIKSYESVWDAICDSPVEAENLRARSELMLKISKIIESKKWTQSEAASHCNISQPRINDLLRGRISKFSIDALVNIAASIGKKVHFQLRDAA